MNRRRAAIIGGGLCGNLLAICLARHGFAVDVFEKRPAAPGTGVQGGRSINLALASRGIHALERFDAFAAVNKLLLPMGGRMIHEPGQDPSFIPYGASGECIHSVSREALNRTLYELAARDANVRFHFGAECSGIDPTTQMPVVAVQSRRSSLDADVAFAADGAGSRVRRDLVARGVINAEESMLAHGYKELSIAPKRDEESPRFALHPGALHIWPRGQFMLIALPNTDASFTATLFLALNGNPGFDTIGPAEVESFFAAQFPDALRLIEAIRQQFEKNVVGELGTVRCDKWHAGKCLLIGDAAHAIVPFHGQGMNAAFEDVAALDTLLEESSHGEADWPEIFAEFERRRIDNTNAIADMAIENYEEMRDTVRDPGFLLRRELALELERRFPAQFASRYSMVMFHPEIPYAQAYTRGARQQAILHDLTERAASLGDIDFSRAAALVKELPHLGQPAT